MLLKDVVKATGLEVLADTGSMEVEVTGGYVSDLLSHVMGKAKSGQIWITMQGHQNIVAVAALSGLAAVVVADGIEVEAQTVSKARDQEVVLCQTKLSVFELTGRLYQMGITGE